ncbi:MAG: hypothetical protein JEY99_15265 [Spirochaetales bacterium]|nr:hypothetical protein [Spirochaetales bacterium]
MKQKLQTKPVKIFSLLLTISFLIPTPLQAEPSIKDITAYLPVYKEYYTKTEVASLLQTIWTIAEEEIETTALESAKEAAADEAGKNAVTLAINQELQIEAARLTNENNKLTKQKNLYKALTFITGGVAIGTTTLATLLIALK